MTPEQGAQLARKLVTARRDGIAVAVDDSLPRPGTEADAYKLQAQVVRAIGPVGGFKTARKPGTPQILAPIFAADIHPAPARIGAGLTRLIGIELEVGFLLRCALPVTQGPELRAAVPGCFSLVPAIEIVESRLDDLDAADALLRLADNQINGGLVLGTPVTDWSDFDPAALTARLVFGGEVLLDGPAQIPGGDPVETVSRFVERLGDHCGGLQPGQVVITGSLNGLPFVERGATAQGRIDGLGAVTARFAP